MNEFEEILEDFKTGNISLMDISKDEISWRGRRLLISFKKRGIVDIFKEGVSVRTCQTNLLDGDEKYIFEKLKSKMKNLFFSDPELLAELSKRNTKYILFEQYQKIIEIERLL